MKKIIFVLSVFLLSLICIEVFSDTLYLKNGMQWDGKIINQGEEKTVFRIGQEEGVDVTFFNDEVLRLDKTGASYFMQLPFSKGQTINVPRPIVDRQPLWSNQTRAIEEVRIEELETQEDQPAINELQQKIENILTQEQY